MSAPPKAPRPEMRPVPVDEVRLTDKAKGWDRYLTRCRLDPARLVESVKAHGVIAPVTVEEWRGGYRVIAGFLRAAAARDAGLADIPALVYIQGALTPKEAYLTALASNASGRAGTPGAPGTPGAGYSDADVIAALARARDAFAFHDAELASTVAPLLGLPPSPRVVRDYLALSRMPAAVLSALADGAVSRQHVEALLPLADDERESVFHALVLPLRLSAGDTRLAVGAAIDLAARAGSTPGAVLDEALREADAADAADTAGGPRRSPDEATALKGRRARLKDILARRLAPTIAGMEDEFQALSASIAAPAGMKVEHAAGFEADEITISIKARDAAALEAARRAIERGLASGAFEDMLSIARRKADDISRGLHEEDAQ